MTKCVLPLVWQEKAYIVCTYVFLLCWHKCTYVCWSCLIVLQVLHVDMKVLTTYQSPHLHHPTAPAAGTSAPPSWSTGASLTCESMSTSPPTTPWGSTSAGRDWQGSAPASRPGGGGGGCKAVFVLKSVSDQTYVMYDICANVRICTYLCM